ncbi:MAG: 5'/3'-nucleotidase SurE [Anaerolineae bacterium]
MSKERPLIVVTNDDGIDSDGLWAAAEAVLPLGEILVVAPDRQWSGGGRSMPRHVTGRIQPVFAELDGERVTAYAVDASPALAVDHAVIELAPRPAAIVVSGINYGANLGIEVTISGTVGAALEASAFGIPAMAVSLEMGPHYHLTGDDAADYAVSGAVIRQFAAYLLAHRLPRDVDILNINVPAVVGPQTAWRLTHLSRRRYFLPVPPDRANGEGRPGYRLIGEPAQAEPHSDIRAVMVDRMISVTPLSLDLTSRINLSTAHHSVSTDQALDADELFAPSRPSCGADGRSNVAVDWGAGHSRCIYP